MRLSDPRDRHRGGLLRRLDGEDGFALPLAASILVLAGLLVLATLGFATHNTDRANRDRDAVRAAQAADAGVDAALYRLNKTVVASQVEGILGQVVATVAETACVQVNAGQLVTVSVSGDWCDSVGGSEQIDGGLEGGPGWKPAGYAYWVSGGTIDVGGDPNDPNASLINRRVVSVGTVGDVQKRVLATVRLRLSSEGNLLNEFEQIGYRTCPPEATDAEDPASGC